MYYKRTEWHYPVWAYAERLHKDSIIRSILLSYGLGKVWLWMLGHSIERQGIDLLQVSWATCGMSVERPAVCLLGDLLQVCWMTCGRVLLETCIFVSSEWTT